MSRKALFRVAALGAAGLGACAVLAACSPVQAGAAATVGSQRITVSSLDTQVSNLQVAAKPYGSSIPAAATEPSAVLSWLIRFAIMDQVAAANGISVTQAQVDAAQSTLNSEASTYGASDAKELLIGSGVPPQLFSQAERWQAETVAYELKVNGGKQPSSQAEATTLNNASNKAQCTAAKTLNIRVSPQFGRFDYASATFGVVAAADTLSKPEVSPSPASTEGLTPAC